MDYTQANKRELNELTQAVIVHEKLRNADIKGDYKVIRDFLRLGKKFTPVDKAVMKDRQDRGLNPIEYMREVVAAKGARPVKGKRMFRSSGVSSTSTANP
ncbi:hypothetical protein [Solidesulfovibrio fructosivorans]|uniref:hypothetical protein n=1 Tax=Solidesulfovibrio fructosivorans TaxID=878 RepID=UPI0011805599|nr:hypothetical protein [Solidesulfovibrio fructosivorans]